MKIAIISDTHNNEDGTLAALRLIAAEGIQEIIHCGDIASASCAELFAPFCVHHVRGNNDWDDIGIALSIEQCCKPGSTSDDYWVGKLGGKTMAAVHGHHLNEFHTLLEFGKFDYIFHGHTHQREHSIYNERTEVICPGAIGGRRPESRSFCVLDTETGEVQFIDPEA